jgi:hypothetical protein
MTRVIITALLLLTACSPPPEQPELQTYGTGTPTCILFCTASAVFAEGSQITNTLGDTTATGGVVE